MVGRPSVRKFCLPENRCGQPVGESSHFSVDGQVEQPIAVIHRLDAANRRPVSLEDIGSLSQVADDVHHAHSAPNQESVERIPGSRIPGHLPAHEVAVSGALFIGALAEHGEGGVAGMNIGQLADL